MNLHPLLELARDILMRVPLSLLPLSASGILFWLVAFLVWSQYRRVAGMERKIHGFVINDPYRSTVSAAGYGIVAGIIGSIILVFTGVVLFQQDIIYLWPVALVLMLVNPRFLCFSYAAGLLALSHLILGWPAQMNVAGIMALVAILHLMEGLLVLLSGDAVCTPVYLRQSERVVGAYLIQRFWPIPLMLIFFLQISPEMLGETVEMPGWWPLIEVAPPAGANWTRIMTSVVAALGYSDIAVTERPRVRARRSAHHLWIFSIILLSLSWGIAHIRSLVWVAALFSPLGHEAMVKYGGNREMRGPPGFVSSEEGVALLDVRPRGPGYRLGLRRGDVVLAVDGEAVSGRRELAAALAAADRAVELSVRRAGEELVLRGRRPGGRGGLEVVTAPEEGDHQHVDLSRGGVLAGVWRRLLRKFGSS
ncbi:MAG: PDZ domain-containing protein [Bacillota bacterium]